MNVPALEYYTFYTVYGYCLFCTCWQLWLFSMFWEQDIMDNELDVNPFHIKYRYYKPDHIVSVCLKMLKSTGLNRITLNKSLKKIYPLQECKSPNHVLFSWHLFPSVLDSREGPYFCIIQKKKKKTFVHTFTVP